MVRVDGEGRKLLPSYAGEVLASRSDVYDGVGSSEGRGMLMYTFLDELDGVIMLGHCIGVRLLTLADHVAKGIRGST
jgi:hypothetical protein